MATLRPTLSRARQRYQYLRGESDYTTTNAVNDSMINYSQLDILDVHPFSWNRKKTTLTLVAGVANLPTDYNPHWHIEDARIVGTSTGDDQIFVEMNLNDRDAYDANSYIYWLTYDTTTSLYIFNSPTLTGTVTIFYHFLPDELTATSDIQAQTVYLVVPDIEAVAYLAVSKNWIADERNQQLGANFEAKAADRIKALIAADLQFGEQVTEGSVVSLNPGLTQG